VELTGFAPRWEYLSLYQRIDIALDPFPCNGMTTTCDALWMGAPVLTLPGKTPVSRAGLSLLSSIGLEELAATSEDDYVRIAVDLAGDLPRLTNLRGTLRSRMRSSPLMDASRFARNVEAAYRSMWERWLSTGV
jgi:predicted O-linked N-acetylglucosamine transferase (SPINDLY family)